MGNALLSRRKSAGYISTGTHLFVRALRCQFVALAMLCAAALFGGTLSGCGGERVTMTFATGNPNGIYYPYGGGLASIWSRTLDGLNFKAEVTGASVINVIQVARGESEVGIAMGDVVVSAYKGEDRFPEALPLRTLFSAYPNFVHLVAMANSGIERVDDLRGMRVSMGAPGSGTAVAAENILAGLGVSQDELDAQYLNFSGTSDGLKDGVLDAAFVVGGLGIGVVKELALTRDIVIVALTPEESAMLNEKHPAYVAQSIPAGTYKALIMKLPRSLSGTWWWLTQRWTTIWLIGWFVRCTRTNQRLKLLLHLRVTQRPKMPIAYLPCRCTLVRSVI